MNIDLTVKEMFLRASIIKPKDPETAELLEKWAGDVEAELNQLYERLDFMSNELTR